MTIVALPEKDERQYVERCRRARKDKRLALLEGLHALKHALRFGARIEAAYTDDLDALIGLADRLAPDITPRLRSLVTTLSRDAFEALAPRTPETGILTLALRPSIDGDALFASQKAPAILLEDPAHLGNVGAVIRVAAAAGAAAVITSGRLDPWDPAALRGSAGLHFALPVLRQTELPEASGPWPTPGPQPTFGPLIAIDPEGEPFRPSDLPAKALLAFGSERQGLSPDLLRQADRRLSLPMRDGVSSLNLATAVSAVLYAWHLNGGGVGGVATS